MANLEHEAPSGLMTETCGCALDPRRVCDVCYGPSYAFLSCSKACLDRHLAQQHPSAAADSAERARAYVTQVNSRFPDSFVLYAEHRARLAALIGELPQGDALCVLGAGNCSDLDLPALARAFRELHLVDVDGSALERACSTQPPEVRERLRLHPGIDLSGLASELDRWGERFPEPTELMSTAVRAAQGILRQIGQPFSAVVSACVLSQLAIPFHRSWITSRSNWSNLLAALQAVHLATLAGLTRPGGAGVLVFDVASSKDQPQLRAQRGLSSSELAAFVDGAVKSGALHLRPEPARVQEQMAAPGLRGRVSALELHSPWLWELGDATQLVYALSYRHP